MDPDSSKILETFKVNGKFSQEKLLSFYSAMSDLCTYVTGGELKDPTLELEAIMAAVDRHHKMISQYSDEIPEIEPYIVEKHGEE